MTDSILTVLVLILFAGLLIWVALMGIDASLTLRNDREHARRVAEKDRLEIERAKRELEHARSQGGLPKQFR